MEENHGYQKDIASIRQMMERSTKFISLSGLSGIMSGIYALAGAALAYPIIGAQTLRIQSIGLEDLIKLLSVAITVLTASLVTGIWLSNRKARRAGVTLWDPVSRRLMINLSVPLATGGLFIAALLSGNYYAIIAPSFLIFYGLALINASPNLYDEVRYLGYCEILLGLVCTLVPSYGLILWATGFGLCHIIYGAVMYRRYETPDGLKKDTDR